LNNIQIRNINTESDLEEFTEFFNLAHADYPEYNDLTTDIIREHVFDAPDFVVGSNFLALDGSRIVGRGRADFIDNSSTIIIRVLPEFRNTYGIEEMLYDAMMNYLAPNDLKIHRTTILSQFKKDIAFFESKNFKEKNRQYTMNRDMSQPVEKPVFSDGMNVRTPDLKKEYDAVKAVLVNGFSNGVDDTAELEIYFDKFTKRNFSQESVLTVGNSNGALVGICVASIHPAIEDKGVIPWLAVLKEYRGKGLGKALLLAGLERFKGMEKIKKAELCVDLDNPNALKLYKGVGFEVVTETVMLEKKID